jgi:hypothetical protein
MIVMPSNRNSIATWLQQRPRGTVSLIPVEKKRSKDVPPIHHRCCRTQRLTSSVY